MLKLVMRLPGDAPHRLFKAQAALPDCLDLSVQTIDEAESTTFSSLRRE